MVRFWWFSPLRHRDNFAEQQTAVLPDLRLSAPTRGTDAEHTTHLKPDDEGSKGLGIQSQVYWLHCAKRTICAFLFLASNKGW